MLASVPLPLPLRFPYSTVRASSVPTQYTYPIPLRIRTSTRPPPTPQVDDPVAPYGTPSVQIAPVLRSPKSAMRRVCGGLVLRSLLRSILKIRLEFRGVWCYCAGMVEDLNVRHPRERGTRERAWDEGTPLERILATQDLRPLCQQDCAQPFQSAPERKECECAT